MRKIIGISMFATPFVVMFILGAIDLGLLTISAVFGGIILFVFWTLIALRLIDN